MLPRRYYATRRRRKAAFCDAGWPYGAGNESAVDTVTSEPDAAEVRSLGRPRMTAAERKAQIIEVVLDL